MKKNYIINNYYQKMKKFNLIIKKRDFIENSKRFYLAYYQNYYNFLIYISPFKSELISLNE